MVILYAAWTLVFIYYVNFFNDCIVFLRIIYSIKFTIAEPISSVIWGQILKKGKLLVSSSQKSIPKEYYSNLTPVFHTWLARQEADKHQLSSVARHYFLCIRLGQSPQIALLHFYYSSSSICLWHYWYLDAVQAYMIDSYPVFAASGIGVKQTKKIQTRSRISGSYIPLLARVIWTTVWSNILEKTNNPIRKPAPSGRYESLVWPSDRVLKYYWQCVKKEVENPIGKCDIE